MVAYWTLVFAVLVERFPGSGDGIKLRLVVEGFANYIGGKGGRVQ